LSPAGQPGPLLGSGRSAEIYDLGHGRVLRRYRDRGRLARREAEVISWVGAHGVPVPEVFDVDGPDIVMEKVDGPTMLADLARRPWRLVSHAAALARLHERVHAVPAIDGAWQQAVGRAGQRLFADAVLRRSGLSGLA
jgi:aminoglycoside phosphotransferase (APT) family kinase protein